MPGLLDCDSCARLTAYRKQQSLRFPDYHNRPVPPLGNVDARLLIVGLAPGLHGANATGIPFCGDSSGNLLFDTLIRHGFATHSPRADFDPAANPLIDCRITNAVKCLPPSNRPSTEEIRTCNSYLRAEIEATAPGSVLLALGAIAHQSILRAMDLGVTSLAFGHLACHALPGERWLLDSYHCSRYNINTGRLDAAMFDAVFERARQLLQ